MTTESHPNLGHVAMQTALQAVPLEMPSSELWCRTALSQPQALLNDHCQCELKAASSATALVAKHPTKHALATLLVGLAQEELQHYRQVRRVMEQRGYQPTPPMRSPYVQGLSADRRGGRHALLDVLLTSALVEARSCERFLTLARGLKEGWVEVEGARELERLYEGLARSESGHAHLFVDLAQRYFDPDEVETELARRSRLEADVLSSIPVTPRMHGGNGPRVA